MSKGTTNQKTTKQLNHILSIIDIAEQAETTLDLADKVVEMLKNDVNCLDAVFFSVQNNGLKFCAASNPMSVILKIDRWTRPKTLRTVIDLDQDTPFTKAVKEERIITTNSIRDLTKNMLSEKIADKIQKLQNTEHFALIPCCGLDSPEALLAIATKEALSEQDKLVYRVFAKQIGYTLHGIREKEQSVQKFLKEIAEITDTMERSTDYKDFAQNIVDLITSELGFRGASLVDGKSNTIVLSHQGSRQIRKLAKIGISKHLKGKISPLLNSSNLIGRAAQTRKIQYTNSYFEMLNPPMPKTFLYLLNKTLPLEQNALIPLIGLKGTEAVLIIGTQKNTPFTPTSKALFKVLSKLLGNALYNQGMIREFKDETKDLYDIMDNLLDGVIFAKEEEVHYISPKLTELTEYPPEEILSIQDILKLVIPEDRKKLTEYARLCRQGQSPQKIYRTKILTKTGRIVPVELRISPIKLKGEEMFIGSIRDISKQEAALDQLENVYRNQAELFAEIAHSLNTPFTIIKGLIELNIPKYRNTSYSELLKVIQEEVGTASEKISELLQVAKLDLKNYTPTFKTINSKEFIQAVYVKSKALGYKYCTSSHDNECDCITLRTNDSRKIKIDTNAIMDVLMTIIENAYQHSPPKGKKAKITINSVYKEDDSLEITVADKGKGISPTELKTIFDPFSYDKKTSHGHGIGLPLCKRIIEQNKGTIQVTSKVKKGTTFKINLPPTLVSSL